MLGTCCIGRKVPEVCIGPRPRSFLNRPSPAERMTLVGVKILRQVAPSYSRMVPPEIPKYMIRGDPGGWPRSGE